ncbi:MAG: hypothetical protein ACJA0S_001029 [Rickettsiales bacterium]|jgi:hypothetical protein
MKKIDLIESILKSIGFEIIKHNDSIQITGFDNSDGQEFPLEEVSELISIFIVFDEPDTQDSDYLFQGCELKVYFDDPKLEYQAKEVKFYVFSILHDYEVFDQDEDLEGSKVVEMPQSPDEMMVP